MGATPTSFDSTPRAIAMPLQIRVVFGGAAIQGGCLLLLFGILAYHLIVRQADWSSLVYFRNGLERTTGRISGNFETGNFEGSRPHHVPRGSQLARRYLRAIEAFEYEYSGPSGERLTGVSYGSGCRFSVGDEVTVEYRKTRPTMSRIEGLRAAPFPPWVAVYLLVPLSGLVLIVGGLRWNVRIRGLLFDGETVVGRLVERVRTNLRMGQKVVYRATYDFEDTRGRARRTRVRALDQHCREESTHLLYDPMRPNRSCLVASLPCPVGADADGRLLGPSWLGSCMYLVLPVTCLVVAALFAAW